MKAILVLVFAVYVTTIASVDDFVENDKPNKTNFEPKMAFYEMNDEDEGLRQCKEKTGGNFSLWDYSVVIAMLAVSLKIGVFYGFFHKSAPRKATEQTLPSKMGLFPVTLSLTTSFVTAIELLGNPAEMYFYGTQFALIGKLLRDKEKIEGENDRINKC